jgi:hypothetical protein
MLVRICRPVLTVLTVAWCPMSCTSHKSQLNGRPICCRLRRERHLLQPRQGVLPKSIWNPRAGWAARYKVLAERPGDCSTMWLAWIRRRQLLSEHTCLICSRAWGRTTCPGYVLETVHCLSQEYAFFENAFGSMLHVWLHQKRSMFEDRGAIEQRNGRPTFLMRVLYMSLHHCVMYIYMTQ